MATRFDSRVMKLGYRESIGGAGATMRVVVNRLEHPSLPRLRNFLRPGTGAHRSVFVLITAFAFFPSAISGFGAEPITARSQSGQFVVRGLPMGAPSSRFTADKVDYLRLDPTLTAVSLERIREGIADELALKDRWRGLITVTTVPVAEDNPDVQITSVHYADGWGYRVAFPERIDKERFIKVAVQVILSEIANRKAVTREAEIPLWLTEGLAAHLEHSSLSALALEPETRTIGRQLRRDPLLLAREILRRRPALRFDELCMPLPEHLLEENFEVFRACSQVFVSELLRLRDGRDCLRDMVLRLPLNLNWQTTFIQAFNGHFQRLIDADKWYALSIASVTGRDLLSRWPLETTWKQLDEILSTQVEVRLDAGELPIQTSATLQRIVTEWNFERQQLVIAQKVARLQALYPRAAPELTELIQGYAQLLDAHVNGRAIKLPAPSAGPVDIAKLPARLRNLLRDLSELDARREKLREGATSTPVVR